MVREKPKYALIDLELSGADKTVFDGIKLFKFIFEKKLDTKAIVVSAHSFEYTKSHFEESLGELFGDKLEPVLKDIQDNYIDKLSDYNYVIAIKDRLEILEQKPKRRR